MIFLLRPPTIVHCDVTMHALYFFEGENENTQTRVSHLWWKKRGMERGNEPSALGWKMNAQTNIKRVNIRVNGQYHADPSGNRSAYLSENGYLNLTHNNDLSHHGWIMTLTDVLSNVPQTVTHNVLIDPINHRINFRRNFEKIWIPKLSFLDNHAKSFLRFFAFR